MALGDGQGPPLGVLHLVESGPLWAFIRFFCFFFLFILLGLTFGIVILRASMPIGYFVIFSFMDA